VRGTDLVVPVGADQQQVPHVRLRDEVLEQVECPRIQPLQIIQEQGERVFRSRENGDKTPEQHLEPILRVLRREVRDWRLRSEHELQFGHKIHDELSARAERLAQRVTPPAKLLLTLPEERAHEALECLGSVAYGMSRLYWSNLPEAKSPRGVTSTLCSS